MSPPHTYDLVVLGGGATAFAAITEASQRGLSTATVNAGLPLGGTCVNVGCVPTKHLLAVAETAFEPPHNSFDAVQYDDRPTIDWSAALDEKDRLVTTLRQQNYVDVVDHFGVDVYEGHGRFVDDTTIEIASGPDNGTRITGERALVATGSSPDVAPIDGIEDVAYETSETILERNERPESTVIVGGGYVGLEWGQILHRMGTEVTILQRSEHVLSGMEAKLGKELQRCFLEEGIDIVTGVDVRRVRATADIAADGGTQQVGEGVLVETTVDGTRREFAATDLFVATGVRPNTEDVGLETIGVETDESGAVVVDDQFRTNNPKVYAAGDVIGEPLLETVAAKEGNRAVRNAFGDETASIDYDAAPEVVFTSPEVATVGVTNEEYKAEHGTCSCRTVRMADVPKAKAVGDTCGLIEVVKHHETDEIVGVHVVAARAADMIPEATIAVKFGLTVDDVIDTIHPFPSFSEGFKHACQAFRRDVSTMSCCVE